MRLDIPDSIETERLNLFRIRDQDAEEIFFTYASKPAATKYLSWPTHQSLRDTRAFIRYAHQQWEAGKDFSFVIRRRSPARLIGSLGLINDDGRFQIGYVLGPNYWGQGYATEAVRTVLKLLASAQRVSEIRTFVDASNAASIRVLLKAGMVEESREEKWFQFVNQGDTYRDCVLFRFPLDR